MLKECFLDSTPKAEVEGLVCTGIQTKFSLCCLRVGIHCRFCERLDAHRVETRVPYRVS